MATPKRLLNMTPEPTPSANPAVPFPASVLTRRARQEAGALA
jgi:hypothetical protein